MDQSLIPVTHQIVKAKIKDRKWKIEHPRAKITYGEARKPNFKIEREWPKKVRTPYSRLRTGHAKELKQYRNRIEQEDDALCEMCQMEEETTKHILCMLLYVMYIPNSSWRSIHPQHASHASRRMQKAVGKKVQRP